MLFSQYNTYMKSWLVAFWKPGLVRACIWIAVLLGTMFALETTGLLAPVREALDADAVTYSFGSVKFSLYRLLKALIVIMVLFWFAGMLSDIGARYLNSFTRIRASNRALVLKMFQVVVYFLIFLVALDVLGIDLTALTVLGGAIGIGIGFGLQKITSNFISGIILLFEKSVEEGDMVELADGTSGFVRHMSARYTLMETFDGKEIMVPNEDFITNNVVNWTFSNPKGRIEISIGVSYESDIELARTLILDAAEQHPRCSKEPAPACFLSEFADSAVVFLLQFWVDDVTEGRLEPKSDVLRTIWRSFREHNISIPYPQRDIHIRNPEALS